MKPDKQTTLSEVCDLLTAHRTEDAKAAIRENYPFSRVDPVERRYGQAHALRVFLRDGFIDRYSRDRLVFPGALRLISLLLPEVFPYHPNWKMSDTHLAFWELSATVDHVLPVARGGSDHEDNWATTSMLRNSAKANWTLEELGWRLREPEPSPDWDGLFSWFRTYVQTNPAMLQQPQIRSWERAASTCGV